MSVYEEVVPIAFTLWTRFYRPCLLLPRMKKFMYIK